MKVSDGQLADKISLIGVSREQISDILVQIGAPDRAKMRANQLWQWIYHYGCRDFAKMTNLAKPFRSLLAQHCTLERSKIAARQIARDGCRKYLLEVGPGKLVESVYIPDEDRGTLCVSSQVGCALRCKFCHTGTQRFEYNLTAGEIVGQLLLCRDDLDAWPGGSGQLPDGKRLISNIVLMGMGEPLQNYKNVKDAMHIVMDAEGLALSRRRITLSTAGVVPMIEKAGKEMKTMLAISLHATTDELRDKLVPINRKWNLAALMQACRQWPRLGNSERITFEYVMLKGVNDSKADAKRLLKLISGIPAKINLIPFNSWQGAPFECSDWEQIEAFAEIINNAGYASPIRTPRGRDILAACGQLKGEYSTQQVPA